MKVDTKLHEELTQMAHELQQAISIAKAGNYAMHTTYVKKLNSEEETAEIFNGIETLLSPIQNKLFDLGEKLETVKG